MLMSHYQHVADLLHNFLPQQQLHVCHSNLIIYLGYLWFTSGDLANSPVYELKDNTHPRFDYHGSTTVYDGRLYRATPILVNLDRSPEVDENLSKSRSRIHNHSFNYTPCRLLPSVICCATLQQPTTDACNSLLSSRVVATNVCNKLIVWHQPNCMYHFGWSSI